VCSHAASNHVVQICKPPNAAVVGFDVGGVIGSGLSKICAIGAGKLEGAKAYHNHVLELVSNLSRESFVVSLLTR
jgi:hypothetical protein